VLLEVQTNLKDKISLVADGVQLVSFLTLQFSIHMVFDSLANRPFKFVPTFSFQDSPIIAPELSCLSSSIKKGDCENGYDVIGLNFLKLCETGNST
jgi:hypothetical protein